MAGFGAHPCIHTVDDLHLPFLNGPDRLTAQVPRRSTQTGSEGPERGSVRTACTCIRPIHWRRGRTDIPSEMAIAATP